jgi:hypothetical protein
LVTHLQIRSVNSPKQPTKWQISCNYFKLSREFQWFADMAKGALGGGSRGAGFNDNQMNDNSCHQAVCDQTNVHFGRNFLLKSENGARMRKNSQVAWSRTKEMACLPTQYDFLLYSLHLFIYLTSLRLSFHVLSFLSSENKETGIAP